MNNFKKVILKQHGQCGSYMKYENHSTKDRDYEVVGLENTIGYEIGEVLSKDDVQQLICRPNMKVVVR